MEGKKERDLNLTEEIMTKNGEFPAVEEDEEKSPIVQFNKPYLFEKQEYKEVDLSGMEELTGADMIAINKIMQRSSDGVDIMPEVSLEYACHFAARAAKLPVEFFLQLSPKDLLKVKKRVMSFLFGSE